jgi:competence protein ComEC
MKKALDRLLEAIGDEVEQKFFWMPVFLGIGIGIFFKLDTDPDLNTNIIMCGVVTALALLARIKLEHASKSRYALHLILAASALISAGITTATIRTINVQAPVLPEKMENIEVVGNIFQLERKEEITRILLGQIEIEDLPSDKTPEQIRVNTRIRGLNLDLGQRISFNATLMPPAPPIEPGGFDFARYAYFKQIGATGYTTGGVKVVEDNVDIGFLRKLRNGISQRLRQAMSPTAAAMAMGLLVGDPSNISEKDYDAMRISGLAHLLAISGMHMAIVVSLAFFACRWSLGQIGWLALRCNIKKVSAGFAIIFSLCYLFIAGSPVSAERAFLMSSLMLIAILLDRNSSSLRAVAIAAFIILLTIPEALLTASFQMSFAACIALVASFSWTSKMCFKFFPKKKGEQTRLQKAIAYGSGTVIATLIAGFATAPFAVYHFNTFSTYNLLANLIAVPLNDFWVMPCGVVSVVLMPLHLEWIPLQIMEYGINLTLWYAHYISSLPHSTFYFPSFSDLGLVLIVLGGLMMSFMATKLRLVGIPLMIFGLTTSSHHQTPDVMVDQNGKLFAIKEKEDKVVVSSKVAAKFTRKVWLRSLGQDEAKSLSQAKIKGCTSSSCIYQKDGYKVILSKKPAPAQDCTTAEVFVNLANEEYRCDSAKSNVTLADLRTNGGYWMWITPEGIQLANVGELRKKRMWVSNNKI